MPYHDRIDDGYPKFVNNDHSLLSASATINLARHMPTELVMLPMARTICYIPTGLDIWNQKMNKAPGHYTRGFAGKIENLPAPHRSPRLEPAASVNGSPRRTDRRMNK